MSAANWRGAAVLVLAAALGLTACQAIPSSGPPREGLTNLEQVEQQVLFDPHGPVEGASPEDIVQGFLLAASSGLNDYAVARQFLTPEYADDWNPSDGVTIYTTGSRPFIMGDDDRGMLRLNVEATVDAQGSLTPARPGPAVDFPFELVQVGEAWRIASAPTGILLDRSTFSAVWSSSWIYFLTTDNKLVPEARWFLKKATQTTQLVGELLDGPRESLRGTLRTAFPNGTTIQNNSVPIVAGTVRIDLSPEMLSATDSELELMRNQLAASLQSVPGATHYEMNVGGAPFLSGPVGFPEQSPGGSEHQGTVVFSEGTLGTIAGGKMVPLPGIGQRIAELEPTAVALSADRRSAAVRSEAGISLVLADSVTTFDVRPGQLEPDLDRFGWVWSFSSASPGRALISAPGQSPIELELPLGGVMPKSVQLSPSGTRIAMLMSDGENSAVHVAAIARDGAGKPISVTSDTSVQLWASGAPIDLDWIDELRLVTLTKSGSAAEVSVGGVGLLSNIQGAVPGGSQVVGGGRTTMLRVLDEGGHMFAPQGVGGWQRQYEDIRLIAKTS